MAKPDFRPMLVKGAGEISLKDVDTAGRTVTGYFASLNTLDSDGDVFAPGAFTKSIKENKDRILHLLQHNPNLPLGRPNVLKEDGSGLYFETVFPDTQLANDTLKLYEQGVYNEHSVGFEMIKSEPDKVGKYPTFTSRWNQGAEQPANVITEAKLWEGSTVSWGANADTPFLGVKLLEGIIKRKGLLESAIKSGNLADDTYMQLQIELKQLQTLMEQATKAQQPPQKGTVAASASATEPLELETLKQKLSTIKF